MYRFLTAVLLAICFSMPVAHAEIVQMTPVVDLSDAKTDRVYIFKYDTDRRVLTVDAPCPGLGTKIFLGSPSGALGGTVNRLGPLSKWDFHVAASDMPISTCVPVDFTVIANEKNRRILYLADYSLSSNAYAQEITPSLVSLSPDSHFVLMSMGLDPRLVENRKGSPAGRLQIYDLEGSYVFGDFYAPGFAEWKPSGLFYAQVTRKVTTPFNDPSLKPEDQLKRCYGDTGWLLEWRLFDGRTSLKADKPAEIYCPPPMED